MDMHISLCKATLPQDLPLTRITTGDWNDTAPALSPDRTQLAFASDRNGFWDLYVMDLQTGDVKQITDSPEYNSAPSWSPDAQWLVFETYINDNLEVSIVSVNDRNQLPSFRLHKTLHPITRQLGHRMAGMWPSSPHAAAIAMYGSQTSTSQAMTVIKT